MLPEALTIPGVAVGAWQVRSKADGHALALYDRHYSRQQPGRGEVGPPGRKLVLVSPCERAMWCTHWPDPAMTLDHLDAYRCSAFRNEGAGLASDLIVEAMRLTLDHFGPEPPDGWVTWVDTREVASAHPGYCFKRAGWWLDREWSHRYLIRLRACDPSDLLNASGARLTKAEGAVRLPRINVAALSVPTNPERDTPGTSSAATLI